MKKKPKKAKTKKCWAVSGYPGVLLITETKSRALGYASDPSRIRRIEIREVE